MEKRSAAERSTPSVVGETELARWFFAGRYEELIATTYDSNDDIAPADLAFVVGALTFVDRVDDARAAFEVWRARAGTDPDPRTVAACRFFRGLPRARAGSFDRSSALRVAGGFRARHDPDPWVRALIFQG